MRNYFLSHTLILLSKKSKFVKSDLSKIEFFQSNLNSRQKWFLLSISLKVILKYNMKKSMYKTFGINNIKLFPRKIIHNNINSKKFKNMIVINMIL